MILSGRAENVESDGIPIRSPSFTLMLPAVIRTEHFIRRPYRHRISFSKKKVFRRDNYTCQYCGHSGRDLTIDHVIPKSRGGRTSWENMVVACKRCNLRKGNRTLAESRLTLLRSPREPQVPLFYANPSLVPRSLWESWKKYLYSKSGPY